MHYDSGTNDQLFPITSEMSQMIFSRLWLIWSCLSTYLSLRMSYRGTLDVSKILGGRSSSHLKLSAALMGPVESSRTWNSRTILGDILSLFRNFQATFFNIYRNILVVKCEKHNFRKL